MFHTAYLRAHVPPLNASTRIYRLGPRAAHAFQPNARGYILLVLAADLEWKVVYVGSAAGPQYDQELENVLVGPVPVGTSKFVLTAPPPDAKLIPEDDVLGATVVLVCCSYKSAEFIRVGYWINNTYGEALPEGEKRNDWAASAAAVPFHKPAPVLTSAHPRAGAEPPKPTPPEKVIRSILADKPRVTRFNIEDWA